MLDTQQLDRQQLPPDVAWTEHDVLIRDALLTGLSRYPVVRKAMLRVFVQTRDLEKVVDRCRITDNPETGRPYLSVVFPTTLQERRAPRFYRTEYTERLAPFLASPPLSTVSVSFGERAVERQELVGALSYFPILNPSLLQSALNNKPSRYWKDDLHFLLGEGLVKLWHPNLWDGLLEREDVEKARLRQETIQHELQTDITYRGTRYYLTKHEERLRPFLIR